MPTNYLAQTKSPGLIFLWQNNCSARGHAAGGSWAGEGEGGKKGVHAMRLSPHPHVATQSTQMATRDKQKIK